jgi:hypothetical protein
LPEIEKSKEPKNQALVNEAPQQNQISGNPTLYPNLKPMDEAVAEH